MSNPALPTGDRLTRAVAADIPRADDDRSPRRVVFATTLTAIAGYIDAVGFVPASHLYLSFMSGNSTHLGMSFANGDWSVAQMAASVIAAFVIGVSAGTHLADRFPNVLTRAVLSGELLVISTAIALLYLGHERIALVMVAMAMGIHNTLHLVIAKADVGRGFITGNLFSLGQALARVYRDGTEFKRAAQNAFSWISFITGVVGGTWSFVTFGLVSSLTAVALAVACLIVAASLDLL